MNTLDSKHDQLSLSLGDIHKTITGYYWDYVQYRIFVGIIMSRITFMLSNQGLVSFSNVVNNKKSLEIF